MNGPCLHHPDKPAGCPVCGHSTISFWLNKNGINLYLCSFCGIGFRYPLPTHTELLEVYSEALFLSPGRKDYYIDDQQSARVNALKSLNIIQRHISGTGRLLDAGCGFGHFLSVARDTGGFDVTGCELSDFAAEQARKTYNLNILGGSIRDAVLSDSYHVITLWGVIEHLVDPIASLRHVTGQLEPDGIVVMSTGDRSSLTARILGKRWSIINPLQHLYYFNQPSIDYMLSAVGLERIAFYRLGRVYNLRYIGQKIKENYNAFRAVGSVIQALFPQNRRMPINLGDIIGVVAKRTPSSE